MKLILKILSLKIWFVFQLIRVHVYNIKEFQTF